MCEYCKNDFQIPNKRIEDEYGEYEAAVVKLTPLPAIDLTTGEVAKHADPPYHAIFTYYMGEKGECGSFVVRYCPMCGRKL